MFTPGSNQVVRRYLVAALLGVIAGAAVARLQPLFGAATPFLSLPVVMGVAWSCGLGPGLIATVLPLAIAVWMGAMATGGPATPSLWLFVTIAVLFCVALRQVRKYGDDEHDIRVAAQRLLHRRTRADALATALSAARTVADVTNASATELMRATRAATASVALEGADGTTVEIAQSFGYDEPMTAQFARSSNTPIAASMRLCDIVIAPPDGGEEAASALPSRHDAFVIVPLVAGTRALGAVLLGFEHARLLDMDEREDLLEAGRLTAQALERARAYDSAEQARADGEAFQIRADAELRERRRAEEAHRESEARYRVLAARTHRLYNLSAGLSEAVTLDAVAKAVVRQGRSVVGAAAGSVSLCAEGDILETVYAEDYPPQVVEAWDRFEAAPGMCTTEVMSSRAPVLVGSFAEWQQRFPRSAATAADGGFTSVASLPLLVDNAPIGVLSFHFTVPVNFDHDYRALLTSVAHHAAQAMDRARLYETTQRARLDAEAANRAKDDFLSIVSHELRTPLNAILGWGTMLRQGALDAVRARRATEAIVTNATRQARLIDDLLDVSRIIAGRVSLDLQELELGDLIRGAVEAMLPTAAQRSVELHVDHLPRVRVVADPQRLQQVFGNLLANAVKFTPHGGRVTVDGSIDDGVARVRVSDTGCGVEPDVLPHIFERFRQGNNSTARTVGGLGLGLFIVRRIVEALQGQVLVESAGKGAGATFTVALPVSNAAVPETVQAAPLPEDGVARETRADLSGIQVLLVDDEADAREMMSSALELCGAKVTTAASAREALESLNRLHPSFQVLLADIAMPQEDGYSLIRQIRADHNPAIADLPAAAVTACAREDERQRALAAGFHMHLAKPMAPALLAQAVAHLAGISAPSA
jgi:signal transduction histidine kinase/ActR/RegA family two-component response regulator